MKPPSNFSVSESWTNDFYWRIDFGQINFTAYPPLKTMVIVEQEIIQTNNESANQENQMGRAYVERRFDVLSDITDRVALVNSPYDSDLDGAMQEMEDFIDDAMGWDLESLEPDALRFYLSHMSFHREIVAETIAEARQLLMDERRPYVKRLVDYHKAFSRWLSGIEKKYAAA